MGATRGCAMQTAKFAWVSAGCVGLALNRDLARATRIAGFSTLRLYCPLLDNNSPRVPAAKRADAGGK